MGILCMCICICVFTDNIFYLYVVFYFVIFYLEKNSCKIVIYKNINITLQI